ncbi:efflux RND transporter periplasmic adaptor subunit [Thalassotalea profundi]|uniref:MexE family multidrug efflux RND transporter periplasmic adaptor subunit n=1 Tax=Thalassotalea profundi TaxID=2036687 RepID=A0ABQ3IH15_9GAMM|nr:efflux RND transporter periplasmic adaptor subunit [Thalassotalea profundi]GHE83323.1 MexE family multidrug efflux RND transporter periplasmic adaptor subunit [Thalassotalea profundi]
MFLKSKKIIPLIVISAFLLIAYIVAKNPPQTQRGRPSDAPQLNVDVMTLNKTETTIYIDSYGKVQPRTQSILLPQVSGQIIAISPNFRDGGFFEKGDILIELDDRDHKAEIQIAKSALYTAQQALSEEQARVEQAKQDWQRLGNEGQPSELVLRKPQLQSAQAKVYSAQASLAKSELALERTKVKAPFTGRILKKEVDIGQVVSSNTQLAEIYAVDYVEVRLPIQNKDLSYIDLPESNRFQGKASHQPHVELSSDLLNTPQTWQGKVVRTEGAFDTASQQLFVVAQIDDPYGLNQTEGLPLKIGQYVKANIVGKVLKDALVIPNKSIYQGSYVYTVENKVLKRKDVSLAWQNDDIALVKTGLVEGELLVLTPLGQVNSGTPVAINAKDGVAMEKKPQGNRKSAEGARTGLGNKGERNKAGGQKEQGQNSKSTNTEGVQS